MTTQPDAATRAASAIRDSLNINPHGPFNEHAGRAWAEIIRRETAAELDALRAEHLVLETALRRSEGRLNTANEISAQTTHIMAERDAARAEVNQLSGFIAEVTRAYLTRGDWVALKEKAGELLAAHRAPADPAQAHAAELENELRELTERMTGTIGSFYSENARALLATLERERQAQKSKTE